jgi:threonine dehydrogenase-like Zn-dependent dehydrogenase
MAEYGVSGIAYDTFRLVEIASPTGLGPGEVRGKTLFTLISPGTELASYGRRGPFPSYPGYSSVFQVEETGANVQEIKPGDVLFCMGKHQTYQQVDARMTARVPEGLASQKATIARLMGVSMTTLKTTSARPGDIVFVSGLGPVGYLCAHQFALAGYEVYASEPNEERRQMAVKSGIERVFPSIPLDDKSLVKQIALVVECSGHEAAVMDACKVVRRRGEVVMVGVPWVRRTDQYVHDLLHEVFFNFVVLRSGSEWEVPMHSADFQPHSIFSGYRTALRWLKEGRIPVDPYIVPVKPEDASDIYAALIQGSFPGLFAIFDWGKVA